nr:acetate kinase [uncultured Porphyromonas sp.]
MKVLVLNCGSSSAKFQLIDTESEQVMIKGNAERIGDKESFLKVKTPDGKSNTIEQYFSDHTQAVELILKQLTDPQYHCISSLDEIGAVGHRVLHGGSVFTKSCLVTPEVIEGIKKCIPLGPLHNPANLKGIAAVSQVLPKAPQVVVFDTSFHQTMPAKSYMYAIPRRFYDEYQIRRYGFHGTSHRYVTHRTCEILGLDPDHNRLISCHIGNGGSICAVKDGKCIDTTMGLTPLEGLMMGTRSGDIDPAAVLYIMKKEGLTPDQMDHLLNKESGVLGVTGKSSDMRDIEAGVAAGDMDCILALDMYDQRIKKYVGAYLAELGGADAIIFTGGVGENQAITRETVCSGMEFCGIKLDKELNAKVHGTETVISAPDSKVKVIVVPTNEELVIARDTVAIVTGKMK